MDTTAPGGIRINSKKSLDVKKKKKNIFLLQLPHIVIVFLSIFIDFLSEPVAIFEPCKIRFGFNFQSLTINSNK